MTFANEIACQDGSVFLGSKKVGWYHINKTTHQVKATMEIGAHTTTVFGGSEYECSRLLEKQHTKNQSQDD